MRPRTIMPAAALMAMMLASAAAADTAGGDGDSGGVKLRNWTCGLHWSSADRDQWDVFGRDGLPPAEVEGPGRGFGLHLGRRFGGRFLLGLVFSFAEHDLKGLPQKIHDGDLLFTGTVLFNERATLQPFVRGGLGGGAVVLEVQGSDHRTVALGPATIAGGGVLVRLSSRFSLEVEAVARVTNYLEVHDDEGDEAGETQWRVKTSHVGWRMATGLAVWF